MESPIQPPARLSRLPLPTLPTWLKRLTGETRTRILLLYAVTLLAVMAMAVPVFRFFLFAEVDARVRENLREELGAFQAEYEDWQATAPTTDAALVEFIDEILRSHLPEDDNFLIFILDGQFYRSSPRALPEVLQSDGVFIDRWLTLEESGWAVVQVDDPAVGSVIYKTLALEIEGVPKGLFVTVHLSAGERNDALAGVKIFVQVGVGVVIVAFLLAWLGSQQLLHPVQQLAKTVKAINETNLSGRLQVGGSGELADLANTFNTMMNRVQASFDSQRSFINDASHELRTPLTIIQGHLELMGDDPAEQQETLDLVMDEIDRMGRFVNDLLVLAKADRPDFLQPETIDVEPFTEEIFSKARVLADRRWQLQASGQGTFVGDRQRITGALINLAQNATQHTQPEDTIELGMVSQAQAIRFWVRDTGEGISPDDQQRIFDRFARVANRYRRSEGAGLGLAIVKAIVDAHGGHIELTSQPRSGATFSLIFPLELPHEVQP